MQIALKEEYGGMKEVLSNLYGLTGNADHLRLADAFEDEAVFRPLQREEDRLDGLHANTFIPKIIGAARECELTGKEPYRRMAQFFWERVALHRSFANGGNGDYEHFFPEGETAQHLTSRTCETCGTYNMLKLTRHVFAWNPSATIMDFYERALYNHILASQDPRTGMFVYYTPMQPGQFRMYSTPEDSFWCCVGTGMENHARYGELIYARSDDALYVNLFIASEGHWRELGIKVRQETAFPDEGLTRLRIGVQKPTRFTLKIREPGWCLGRMSLTLNGKPELVKADASGYVSLAREWRDGDLVGAQLPMHVRVETLPGNPQIVALFSGPVLLAARLGTDGMPENGAYASPEIGLEQQQEKFAKWPTPKLSLLTVDPEALPSQVKPVPNQALTYLLRGAETKDDVTLIPLFRLHHERYAVYWMTSKRG
jgi:DUF1680 family protein